MASAVAEAEAAEAAEAAAAAAAEAKAEEEAAAIKAAEVGMMGGCCRVGLCSEFGG